MPRNTSGTMSPPGSYPPVDGAIIDLDDYKALVADIISEMTDSLSRNGKGGMLDKLKLVDGSAALPALTFNNEASSGLSRYAAGDVRLSILGNLIAKFIAAGVEVTGTVKASGGLADDTSHGARGGGTQHAVATQSVAGFLSSDDKIRLDTRTYEVAAQIYGLTINAQQGGRTITVARPPAGGTGQVRVTFSGSALSAYPVAHVNQIATSGDPAVDVKRTAQIVGSGSNYIDVVTGFTTGTNADIPFMLTLVKA